jgi:branched-chain amino acid transport system substrate-binding protein
MKKYLTMSVMLLMVVALVAVSANCCSEEAVTYKVGAIFSTTGGASNLGVPEQNTVNMIVDTINKAGGINGTPLKVIVYNDETNAEKAVSLATKLIEQDKVLAIIGPTTSGSSLGILDTITTAQIPLVSCAANIGIVEPVSERYWIFKTPQTDKEAIGEIYKYLESMDISKVAIISNTSGFGATGKAILLEDADDYGITVVDDQVFNEGDTSVQSQLTHIKGTDAEAVVCWDTDKGSAIVALDMQTLQMEMPLLCSHGIANQAFINAAGAAANGVIFPAGKLLIIDDLPADDPQKVILTQYKQNYEAIYGNGTINTFGGHAWDALYMVVTALDKLPAGDPYESADSLGAARAAIRGSIEQITNFAGISGVFDMSPTDHLGMRAGSLAMIEIVDGKWTWSQ